MLVAAAVQDDAAVPVRARRDPRDQPRLADPRLPADEHEPEPARASSHARPSCSHSAPPADERRVVAQPPRQLGRVRPGPFRGDPVERAILGEHRRLQLVQLPADLEAELVVELGRAPLEGFERVRLTTRPVLREHQLGDEPLAERMLRA